jgi:hypothetical protein
VNASLGEKLKVVPATSHILKVTLPFLTFRKLKDTVGTTSSLHLKRTLIIIEGMDKHRLTWPEPMTLTNDVFPEAFMESKEVGTKGDENYHL